MWSSLQNVFSFEDLRLIFIMLNSENNNPLNFISLYIFIFYSKSAIKLTGKLKNINYSIISFGSKKIDAQNE